MSVSGSSFFSDSTSSCARTGFSTTGPTFSSIVNRTPMPSRGSMISAKIIPASTSRARDRVHHHLRGEQFGSFASCVTGLVPLTFL